MRRFRFEWNSLKTRVTLLTLGIFVISIWSLTFYTGRMLREDMKGLLGEQQFSTASLIAAEIDREVADRLQALEITASEITPTMINNPVALQALFAHQPLLHHLFNDGIACAGLAGTVIADYPQVPGRIGANFMERDYVIGPLTTGKATIGKPVRSKLTQDPSFVMAVPIKDTAGRVIGVLAGIINLNQPNFVTTSTGGYDSKGGDFFLVAPQHQIVVASSNKSRILATLPAPGVIPALDRQAQGYEGTQIFVNPLGFEVLTSAKQIPSAGWYIAITLDTERAFAPIKVMQQNMLLAACALTLLVTGLLWEMLRRQLTPLLATANALASMVDSKEFPSALPITRHDEVGHLIAGFNQLLVSLHERDAALGESEVRFRTLIEWTHEAVAVHRGGKLLYANPAALHLFGAASKQDLVGKPMLEFVHPDYRQSVVERMQRSYDKNFHPPMVEEKFLRLDGTVIDVEVTGIVINYDGQSATQVAIHDITERKLAEDQLRTLSHIVEQAPISILITDLDGNIKYANPWITKVTGYSAEEIFGQNPRLFKTDQTPLEVYQDLWQTLRAGGVWRGEFGNRKKNGDVFVEQAVIAPVLDDAGRTTHYVALKEDVTERKRTEHALQTSLQEKVALLNEVHHRVKNNLQVITSLLRLEAGRSSQPDTKSVLTDMQGRIRSMALLHESLYRTGTFASVDLGAYLKQLASQAFRAQSSGTVRLELELASVQVSMDQATPCGLLVNELISNCLKHGFPEGRSGEIRIELHAMATATVAPATEGGAAQWLLRVSDTGVGLPADFKARRHQSLGLQLVADLVHQLGGTLDMGSAPGAVFTVVFTPDAPSSATGAV
ncbi:PAS domain S-box protein [Rhodoferax ferrireducens]|uniref:PAS domain S-box protein n=1 Tax=Rhodoferax ferrireducens TaxID=192843 RepID=UPI00298E108E|nr:PAS domain S-box protein [Rhodoferax ferrireducens]WPC67870.1 PAS domain S-box protein [Rhodoferax ferrireducens]